VEPVYRALEIAAKAGTKALGCKTTYHGLQNIPTAGGAVLAINHTSYVDWVPAALAAHQRGRRVRYLIKAEMQQVRIVDFLIRHTKTVPVDRAAGADAYANAVKLLRAGEVLGVMPEATISRSFELKEFKTGAVRMAQEAQVPVVPLIVWGAQRIWTKDHPRNLRQRGIPITVTAGPALRPTGDLGELEVRLHAEMTALLHRVQEQYPHPEGAYWVPRRLGGGAPSPAEAAVLDDAERARKRTN
jgi:1-acyl-sn-glycerol-3-phosphate acyltransferase